MPPALPSVRLGVSPPRRVLAIGMLGLTGALLLAVGLGQPPAAPLWRLYVVALGAAALWLAHRLWRATAQGLVLDDAGLRESGGRVLCPIDNVAGVERGVFAFKPSGGFVVHMKAPRPRGWAPGLWWSAGRRLGIGGVTRAAEARVMADILAARVSDPDSSLPNR